MKTKEQIKKELRAEVKAEMIKDIEWNIKYHTDKLRNYETKLSILKSK